MVLRDNGEHTMSNKQLEQLRDANLAARVKRAMGGIPGLQLVLAGERGMDGRGRIVLAGPDGLTDRERRILADCRAIKGEV